jgi:tetratricopeptide (TPR) repeat protein
MTASRVLLAAHTRFAAWTGAAEPGDLLAWSGALLLLVASLTGWLGIPLQGQAMGYSLPLWGSDAPLTAQLPRSPVRVASYGALCALIGLAAALAVARRWNRRWLFHLGSAAVLLGFTFYLVLVFDQPHVLEAATGQFRERSRIADFSADVLDGNAAALRVDLPARPRGLAERLSIALSVTDVASVGMGWRIAVLGGLMIQVAAWRRRPRRLSGLDLALVTAALLTVTAVLSARGLLAEVLLIRADRQLAEGNFVRAVELYERARTIDAALEWNAGYCHRIGTALYQLGRVDRAEAHVYLGDNFASHLDDVSALQHYRAALSIRPDLSVAATKAADTLVDLGLVLYVKGNRQSAILRWEEATVVSPSRIDAHFLLGRALFEVNREDQRSAIAENQVVIQRVGDKLVRADAFNNLGDCYSRQNDLAQARVMYRRSLGSFQLVKRVINFNAMTGLQGL